MNVRYRDFLSALSGYDFSAMQLSARNDEKGEWLVMRVESDHREQDIEKRVHETLLEKVENIRERIADRSLLKVDVEWLAPGALPRNPRSGKIKTLIDERA